MVAPVEYPAEFVAEGAISPSEAAGYFGQVLNTPMKRGQIVYRSNLGGTAVDRFSDLLDDGDTAVTLEVDAKKSNSHMLIPGDFVDILVLAKKAKVEPVTLLDLTKAKELNDHKMLVPLLSKVKILSVDRNPLVAKEEEYRIPIDSDGRIPTYSFVTVGVQINDATKLALAQDLGDLVFFLRNSQDPMRVKVRTLDGLFATYESDENNSKNTYEYYSPTKKAKLSFVAKKEPQVKKEIKLNSPALTLDREYPRIESSKP
jgi:pilus assembly protein CpaB